MDWLKTMSVGKETQQLFLLLYNINVFCSLKLVRYSKTVHSSKNENFLLILKQKLGVTANPILNSAKTAYLLHFANNLDSELIFSILYNNIVTPEFVNIFIKFSTKFSFINSLNIKATKIIPSLNDG